MAACYHIFPCYIVINKSIFLFGDIIGKASAVFKGIREFGGEQFASGITVSYRAIEGAVENRKDGLSGVALGAVENVYDNSLLSYMKKGIEIEKKAGDKFYLSLKTEKTDKKRTQIEAQSDPFIEVAKSGLNR